MAKFSVSKLHSQLFQFFPDLKPIKALDLRNFFTGLLDSYLPIFQYRIVKNNLGAEDEIAIGDANKISFLELQKNMGKMVPKPGPGYTLTPADHGNVFYNDSGDLTIEFPDPNTLPIGFEFGAFTSAGDIRKIIIKTPVSYRIQNIRRTDGGITNLDKTGLYFIYLKVVSDKEIAALSVSGAWKTYLDTYEDFEIIYDGRKGGAPKYEDISYAGVGYYPTKDFTDSYDFFDKIKFIDSEINFAISNDKLYWSGSVGKMLITNSHETDDITVEITGLRTYGIEEYYTIPAGKKMYFEALRVGKDTAFWIKAGNQSTGGGGSGSTEEAQNKTTNTIDLSIKQAVYYDPDAPSDTAEFIINDTNAKNMAEGVIYWQGDSWPDFNYANGQVVTKAFTFAPGGTHEIHFWFHKLTGKNKLHLLPVALNSAPIAQNVAISDNTQIGQILTGSYTFFDADEDLEGTSLFKFQEADPGDEANPADIATTENYTLQSAQSGKKIRFGVKPIAATGATVGEWAYSDWTDPVIAAALIIDPPAASINILADPNSNIVKGYLMHDSTEVVYLPDSGDKISFDFSGKPAGNYILSVRGRVGDSGGSTRLANQYIIELDSNGGVVSEIDNSEPAESFSNDLGKTYMGWIKIAAAITITSGTHTIKITADDPLLFFDKAKLTPA